MPEIQMRRRSGMPRWTALILSLLVVAVLWWVISAASTLWRREAAPPPYVPVNGDRIEPVTPVPPTR